MTFLTSFLLFSGVAVLLLIAGVAIRDARTINSSKYFIGMAISVAAILLGFAPDRLEVPQGLNYAFQVIDAPSLIFVWLFGLALFDDEFVMEWGHWLSAICYTALVIVYRYYFSNSFVVLCLIDIVALILVAHLVIVINKGRKDDLLEARRQGRAYFVGVLAGTIFLFTLTDILLVTEFTVYFPVVKIFILIPSIIWVSYWLLRVSPQSLKFEQISKKLSQPISQKEIRLTGKLNAIMQDEQAYLNAGLTIDELAKQMGTTPHSLRALINIRLGYRHFTAYLNGLRVENVKLKLADPAYSGLPILTLALDAGFNSISPFNRAFKRMEGITPSEYRHHAAGKPVSLDAE